MSENSANNKRIAKNTFALYIRMLITMVVGLYTSRVVLHVLGFSDYGLYNVIGGFVSLMAFLNSSMTAGTQRFLTYELGRGDISRLKLVFSNALIIHLLIALLIVLLLETVGLWFVKNEMTIPEGRESAAIYLYHFSVLSMFVTIVQVPFMASLIAHEDLNKYALICIFDVVMKLIVAFLIQIATCDRLFFYASALFFAHLITALIYTVYSVSHYKECSISFRFEKSIFFNIAGFSNWTLIGMLATTANGQGMNVLLNMFLGTVVNAARGIAFQINNVVMQFVRNFQIAANPQIIKLYAEGKIEEMTSLALFSSKISAYLLLIIIPPLYINIEYILHLWLGTYPVDTPTFVRVILLQSIIQSMSGPIVFVSYAGGKMKMPNITGGICVLLSLPLCYFLLYMGCSATTVLIVNITPWLFEAYFDSYYAEKYTGFSQKRFYSEVYFRVLIIVVIVFVIPSIFYSIIPLIGLLRFIVNFLICIVWSITIIYILGIDPKTKNILQSKVKKYISKLRSV